MFKNTRFSSIASFLSDKDFENFVLICKRLNQCSQGSEGFKKRLVENEISRVFGLHIYCDADDCAEVYRILFFLYSRQFSTKGSKKALDAYDKTIKQTEEEFMRLANIILGKMDPKLNFENLSLNAFNIEGLKYHPYMELSFFMVQLLLPSLYRMDLSDSLGENATKTKVKSFIEKTCVFLKILWLWYERNEQHYDNYFKLRIARMTLFFHAAAKQELYCRTYGQFKQHFRSYRSNYSIHGEFNDKISSSLKSVKISDLKAKAKIVLKKLAEIDISGNKSDCLIQLTVIRANYFLLVHYFLYRPCSPVRTECANRFYTYLQENKVIAMCLWHFLKKPPPDYNPKKLFNLPENKYEILLKEKQINSFEKLISKDLRDSCFSYLFTPDKYDFLLKTPRVVKQLEELEKKWKNCP